MPIRIALARLLAWATVYVFALLLGAHMLDTFVLIPHWTASPPESIEAWVTSPQYPDVVPYLMPLLVALLLVPAASFAAGYREGEQDRRWRGIATACALAHLSLLFLFFVPTNQELGFLPSEAAAAQLAPEVARGLVRQWIGWNWVRIALDALGLYAAARATSA
jgi:hypothetical protein